MRGVRLCLSRAVELWLVHKQRLAGEEARRYPSGNGLGHGCGHGHGHEDSAPSAATAWFVVTLVVAIIVTAATADVSLLVSVTVLARAAWYQQHELPGRMHIHSCYQRYHRCVLRFWQWAYLWWIRHADMEDAAATPLVSLHDFHVGLCSGGYGDIDGSGSTSGSGTSGGAADARVLSLAPMASLPGLNVDVKANMRSGGADLAVVLSSGAEVDGMYSHTP